MPERDPPQAPEARTVVKKKTRLSLVWIVPIVAAAVGVWVAVSRIMSEGPSITIELHSAEGLEAGKTKIRYQGGPAPGPLPPYPGAPPYGAAEFAPDGTPLYAPPPGEPGPPPPPANVGQP